MVRRHVGVIGERQWLSTTAGKCCIGACKHREQSNCENFYHGYLFFRATSLQLIKMETNIEYSIHARKLRGGGDPGR
jgi:hypothetical protein